MSVRMTMTTIGSTLVATGEQIPLVAAAMPAASEALRVADAVADAGPPPWMSSVPTFVAHHGDLVQVATNAVDSALAAVREIKVVDKRFGVAGRGRLADDGVDRAKHAAQQVAVAVRAATDGEAMATWRPHAGRDEGSIGHVVDARGQRHSTWNVSHEWFGLRTSFIENRPAPLDAAAEGLRAVLDAPGRVSTRQLREVAASLEAAKRGLTSVGGAVRELRDGAAASEVATDVVAIATGASREVAEIAAPILAAADAAVRDAAVTAGVRAALVPGAAV